MNRRHYFFFIRENQLVNNRQDFTETFIKIDQSLKERYRESRDPWGLEPERVIEDLKVIWPFYRYYFNVRLHGKENVQDKAYMVVSNHTRQIPIDGLLICTAFATELDRPKLLRPLVERFLTSLPFLGRWSSEGGAVLGDRINCLNLLKRGESILVFPEGVKGIAKDTKDHYRLQKFTKGFCEWRSPQKLKSSRLPWLELKNFFLLSCN